MSKSLAARIRKPSVSAYERLCAPRAKDVASADAILCRLGYCVSLNRRRYIWHRCGKSHPQESKAAHRSGSQTSLPVRCVFCAVWVTAWV